jgi:ribosomal protein S18 acetylase RimI-like enzyme
VKIALRNYRHTDFETLHRIDQACYASDTAYSPAELGTYLGFLGAECVVAEVATDAGATTANNGTQDRSQNAARIIGFSISARRGDHGHIITMDVLEEFRRCGIGSALLAEIEKRLVAAGVRRVGLETATDNEAGIAFWRRHGYVSVGVKKGYYAGRRDAYYMTKAIGPEAEPAGPEPGTPHARTGRKRLANRNRKR